MVTTTDIELISNNPSLKVDMPKIHDKAITRLDVNGGC